MRPSVTGGFACRCLTSITMLRFHFPLIEPDGRIYRIRLSDGLHRQAHDHALRCSLRPTVKSLPGRSGSFVLLGRSQSQSLCPFHQRARSEAPLLHRHYPASPLLRASPPPTRPGLALAGCPLRLPPPSSSVSRASCAFLRYVPSLSTPVELQSAIIAFLPLQCCLPRVSVRSASTTSVSRPRRAFICITARIFAGPLLILSIEGSDGFVASSAASIATGQATLPRRDLHPLKHTRIHGARTHFNLMRSA